MRSKTAVKWDLAIAPGQESTSVNPEHSVVMIMGYLQCVP
jgi:hypothetical protein